MLLNEGRQFGSKSKLVLKTPPVSEMKTMDDVVAAYDTQVKHQLGKLRRDLEAVENSMPSIIPPCSAVLAGGMCGNRCLLYQRWRCL